MCLDRPRVRAGEYDDLVDDLGPREPLQGVVYERGVGEREEGLGTLEGDGAEGLGEGRGEFFFQGGGARDEGLSGWGERKEPPSVDR